MSSTNHRHRLPFIGRKVTWRVTAIILWSALAVVGAWVSWQDPASMWLTTLVIANFGWFVYLMLWWPRVAVTDDGIDLLNPIVGVHIPWQDVAEVQTVRQLSITTSSGKRFDSWALPAPGFTTAAAVGLSRTTRMMQLPVMSADTVRKLGDIRLGDMPDNACGATALVIRNVLEYSRPKTSHPASTNTRARLIVRWWQAGVTVAGLVFVLAMVM